jgi:probable F420-dependent oxidoreductase
MTIGKLGVWATTDGLSAAAAAAFAQRVEGWGYGALWMPEAFGRNVLVHSAWLLANTHHLVVASGIANIYARDALACQAAQYGLAEQSAGRFLLGLGVSHVPLVEGLHGQTYRPPIATMRGYLEAMARASYGAPPPADKPKTVIAALGPKMLQLAADLADGAHPYNVTPEHTRQARDILGPDKLLCVEQMVLLESDAATARHIGRQTLAMYLTLPNYRNNWLRLGFTADDCDHGGSDRLIDAMVAWGDQEDIRNRIQQHWDAGADHVCIQSLSHTGGALASPGEKILALLAPAGTARKS